MKESFNKNRKILFSMIAVIIFGTAINVAYANCSDQEIDIYTATCPLAKVNDDDIIINFRDNSRDHDPTRENLLLFPYVHYNSSSWNEHWGKLPAIATNIPSGRYDITLANVDSYLGRVNTNAENQRYEQSKLELIFGDGTNMITDSTTDLEDNCVTAWAVDTIASDLNISQNIVSVSARHDKYNDKSSWWGSSSVYPVCALFEKKASNQSPTAVIDTPANNTSFVKDSAISFNGHASDSDGSIVKYQWCQGSCTNGGTQISTNPNFNYSFLPVGNYVIYFRAQDDDGAWSDQDNVHITITAPIAPSIDLKINGSDGPVNITRGNNLNIIWSSTHATSCSSSGAGWNNSNLSSTSGSANTSANNDSSYRLTCTGPGGQATDNVLVDVSCSSWCGSWSDCSAECDGGSRSRTCITSDCSTINDSQSCGEDPCSHSINWREVNVD